MTSNMRRKEILKILENHGSVTVNDLFEKFAVSPITIRRDLAMLEESGIIERSRGEARLTRITHVPPVVNREDINRDEKDAIARAAMRFIKEGDSIILDCGSTIHALIKYIKERTKLTVITNSIRAASELAESLVTVIVPGGVLKGNDMALLGPECENYFENIQADTLFLATSGVRGNIGLTVTYPFHLNIKRKMIKAAKKVIVLLDHTKFEDSGVSLFANFSEIDCIITDREIKNAELLERLKELKVEIVYPDGADR